MNDLIDATRQLLRNRGDMSIARIARGSGVGIEWLYKFHQGRIPNPGARRLQAVHDYIRSKHDD